MPAMGSISERRPYLPSHRCSGSKATRVSDYAFDCLRFVSIGVISIFRQYTKIGLGVGTVIVLVAVVCVIAFLIYRRRVDLRLRFAVVKLLFGIFYRFKYRVMFL